MDQIEKYISDKLNANYAYKNTLKTKLLKNLDDHNKGLIEFSFGNGNTFLAMKLRYYIMTDTNINKEAFYYSYIFDQLREIPLDFWKSLYQEIIGEVKFYGED
jgi:hypothetical protein